MVTLRCIYCKREVIGEHDCDGAFIGSFEEGGLTDTFADAEDREYVDVEDLL